MDTHCERKGSGLKRGRKLEAGVGERAEDAEEEVLAVVQSQV